MRIYVEQSVYNLVKFNLLFNYQNIKDTSKNPLEFLKHRKLYNQRNQDIREKSSLVDFLKCFKKKNDFFFVLFLLPTGCD